MGLLQLLLATSAQAYTSCSTPTAAYVPGTTSINWTGALTAGTKIGSGTVRYSINCSGPNSATGYPQMGTRIDLGSQGSTGYTLSGSALTGAATSNALTVTNASHTATTTVSNSALLLTKEVRNVTQGGSFGTNNQAKTGEVLEYRIKYTNTALTPLNSLVISDTTPGYTSFVQAKTETTPSSLTACAKVTPVNAGTSSTPAVPVGCDVAQAAGGTGPITWTFTGTLNSGGEGAVLFQVKVD